MERRNRRGRVSAYVLCALRGGPSVTAKVGAFVQDYTFEAEENMCMCMRCTM